MISDEKQLPVYIIGDTPLACFLAGQLTREGESVKLLGHRGLNVPSATLIIKDNGATQKSTVDIQTDVMMHDAARMVILCLSPDKLKSGLAYVSASKTIGCPIVSFCRTADVRFIETILQRPVISAYFDGWMQSEKDNLLSVWGSSKGITVSMAKDDTHFDTVQRILAKTYVKVAFNADDLHNFWTYFIPYAACSLFSLQHGAKIRDIAQKPDYRRVLNTLLDELLSAAPKTLQADRELISAGIYLTPEHYKFPVAEEVNRGCSGTLNFIFDTLRRQKTYSRKALPLTTEILLKNLRKILSSVEE